MVYIIVKKKKPFNESYLTRGGIVRAERDGIKKSTMMQDIVEMTSDLHPDARRDIVDEFIDRDRVK